MPYPIAYMFRNSNLFAEHGLIEEGNPMPPSDYDDDELLSQSNEQEAAQSDSSDTDDMALLPQIIFNLWVMKEGSSKMLPNFKQEVLDLNTTSTYE
jgi:hypothetical protein